MHFHLSKREGVSNPGYPSLNYLYSGSSLIFARLSFLFLFFSPSFHTRKRDRPDTGLVSLFSFSLARSSSWLLGHAFPFDHTRSALSRVLGRFPALLNPHRRRLSAAHCREQGQAHLLRVRRRHFPYSYVFRALYFRL